MEITLIAEQLGSLGPLPITNTMLVSFLVTAILSVFAVMVGRNVKLIPLGIQNFAEMIIETVYQMTEDIAHSRAKVFFPYLMTFFLFIITANWLGLFPGFGTIGVNEVHDGKEVFVPFFRSINSDLNMTMALALISVVLTHIFAVKYLGVLDYLKRWVSLNPIFLFVGILEIVSEFTKVVSLSFRLFGNIFAGEIVLSTMAAIFAFVLPLPFYFLETIVGFVQAAVFMMLTLVFMSLLSEKHAEH